MLNLDIKKLAEKSGELCVSMYMPTHRKNPENKQDPVRFKNLLTKASKKIQENYPNIKVDSFLAEAEKLQRDSEFWNRTLDGLAVLIDKDETTIIKTSGKTPELVVVEDRFHILPFLNYYELPNDYYLLDISRDRFELATIDLEGIKKVETDGIHSRFDELFDDRDIESVIQSTDGSSTGFHGHKSKPEIDEVETEKYFRYVSKELNKFFKEKEHPIVLFGTVEIVAKFKEFSKDELDILLSIPKPLSSMDEREVLDILKEKLLPRYEEHVAERIESLNTEISQDRGTDNLSRIENDAITGRVQTLFLNLNYDKLETEELDKLVSAVITSGGEVLVIDEERTEFPMGLGAIYRF